MAQPGQEGRGVLIYGGPPQQPPTGGKAAPQCPCAPPQTAVPTPALSMGKLRHGALPCLHPTSLPTRTPHGPGGPLLSRGGCSTWGGLEGEPRIHWVPGDTVATPCWRSPGYITAGGVIPPGCTPVSPAAGWPGTPWGQEGGRGAAGCPQPRGRHLGGGWRRVPSDCHFPFTLEEGFATSLPPRAA